MSNPPFWMSNKDKKGRPIERRLIDAAHRIWRRVLHLVEQELHDTSRAAELLESAVHAVSNVVRRYGPLNPIEYCDSYLYLAFTRKLMRVVAKERKIQYVQSVQNVDLIKRPQYRKWMSDFEKDLLIKQVIAYLDPRTRRKFIQRTHGRSWKEIASKLGITPHNAKVQFDNGVKRAYDRIFKGLRNPKNQGSERH